MHVNRENPRRALPQNQQKPRSSLHRILRQSRLIRDTNRLQAVVQTEVRNLRQAPFHKSVRWKRAFAKHLPIHERLPQNPKISRHNTQVQADQAPSRRPAALDLSFS